MLISVNMGLVGRFRWQVNVLQIKKKKTQNIYHNRESMKYCTLDVVTMLVTIHVILTSANFQYLGETSKFSNDSRKKWQVSMFFSEICSQLITSRNDKNDE